MQTSVRIREEVETYTYKWRTLLRLASTATEEIGKSLWASAVEPVHSDQTILWRASELSLIHCRFWDPLLLNLLLGLIACQLGGGQSRGTERPVVCDWFAETKSDFLTWHLTSFINKVRMVGQAVYVTLRKQEISQGQGESETKESEFSDEGIYPVSEQFRSCSALMLVVSTLAPGPHKGWAWGVIAMTVLVIGHNTLWAKHLSSPKAKNHESWLPPIVQQAKPCHEDSDFSLPWCGLWVSTRCGVHH